MALGANSYGSLAEVVPFARAYLAGESTFSATTRPTLTEVEKFIDRASGVLNLALAAAGFTIPVTQADARLACDDWVVTLAAAYVEASQPFAGLEDNERAQSFTRLYREAEKFVQANAAGFAHLGVSQPQDDSNALIFTGETAQADRADPDNTALEQPKFRRGQFDS